MIDELDVERGALTAIPSNERGAVAGEGTPEEEETADGRRTGGFRLDCVLDVNCDCVLDFMVVLVGGGGGGASGLL